jgi:hypothetical protein
MGVLNLNDMKKAKINSNKKREPNIVFNTKEIFYIMCSSENGFEHEYTIITYQSDLGTHYTMEYSNGSCWQYEKHGVNIFHLINTGNGYEWIDTDPIGKKMDYDNFFMYTTFMRFIQNIEARFSAEVLHVTKCESFFY